MLPSRQSARQSPDWSALYSLAEAQAGHFTLPQALGVGLTKPLVSYHLKTGKLNRVGHGLYRLVQFPRSDSEELVVLWLWSKREGVFSHETALHLHQLSDALPVHVEMTVPTSWASRRLKVPSVLRLHHADLPAGDRVQIGPVPVTSPARTLRDCITAAVSPELMGQALAQARARGLLLRDEARGLQRLRRIAQTTRPAKA